MRWTAMLVVGASSAAWAQTALPYFNPVNPLAVRNERACRSNAFTVEVPEWAGPLPSDFASRLSSSVVPSSSWFGCTASPLTLTCLFRTVVTPVLPDRTVLAALPSRRADGHRRFFTVSFERYFSSVFGASGWSAAEVRPEFACHAVTEIRAKAAAIRGITIPDCTSTNCAQPSVLVARSCEAVAQDVEAFVTPAVRNWAQSTMKAAPNASLQPVTIALVDTGVPPAYRSALRVDSEWSAHASTAYHPHAAHLAALIQSVAPHSRIASYRALDQNGMGTVSQVARAMDEALFASFGNRRPMVMNVSLGLPPDFTRRARLTGAASCSTFEDGVGESMRYVLENATILDEQGPTVLVVASSGNVPLETAATTNWAPWAAGNSLTPCEGGLLAANAPGASAFFPAGYGAMRSCTPSGSRWLSVLNVGASDRSDRRSVLTLRKPAPLLLAPGEAVVADGPGLPRIDSTVRCDSLATGLERGFEMPAVISGTSASAAFVSAAAAQVMARRPDRVWKGPALSRFLYMTAAPVCEGGSRSGRRRLDIGLAEQALVSPWCQQLRECVAAPSAGPVLAETTFESCRAAAAACTGVVEATSCSSRRVADAPWSVDAVSAATASVCDPSWGTAAVTRSGNRFFGPNSVYPDVHLGGLGPQPASSGCPSCQFAMNRVTRESELTLEFNDVFANTVRFADVILYVLAPDKSIVMKVPVTSVRDHQPGEVARVTVTALGASEQAQLADWLANPEVSVVLDLGAQFADGRQARLVSPLSVVLE
jgi:hypothetical protein